MLDYFESVKTVATWFVNRVDRESGEAITHLKLQKLVYYTQAWYLANFDTPLFEEDAQAWAHGPVYQSIYAKYKDHGWEAIPCERKKRVDPELEGFLEAIFTHYGGFGAKQLEEQTHSEAPWIDARENCEAWERSSKPIDKLSIRNYYANKIGKEQIQVLQS